MTREELKTTIQNSKKRIDSWTDMERISVEKSTISHVYDPYKQKSSNKKHMKHIR